MLRRGLIGLIFASGLTLGAAFGEVVVRVAPPGRRRGDPPRRARGWLCLDQWLSAVERYSLCLGPRTMGIAPTPPCSLGRPSLGAS